jgi:hypothetical protein
MRVGEHEAIHGVGMHPSTMNSGAQTVSEFLQAYNGLWNSCGHMKLKSTGKHREIKLLACTS